MTEAAKQYVKVEGTLMCHCRAWKLRNPKPKRTQIVPQGDVFGSKKRWHQMQSYADYRSGYKDLVKKWESDRQTAEFTCEPCRLERERIDAERKNAEVERLSAAASHLTSWLARPQLATRVKREAERELWCATQNPPCGWVSSKSLARHTAAVMVEVMTHFLTHRPTQRKRWAKDHKSESGSRYVVFGEMRLRLSDHDLGYADYGSRKQIHHGPEVVFDGSETWGEALRMVAEQIRD